MKLPLFRNPEDPAEVISNMLFYSSSQKKLAQNRTEYKSLINSNPRDNNFTAGFLSQKEIAQLCTQYNLPPIKSRLVNPSGLEGIEENLFPLVLKGINQKVIHKSELSAVKLNIKNKAELKHAANEIEESFKRAGFEVEEFLIQQFVKTKHELLIGGFLDPSFGPIIMFGSGGKYVEVISDTSMKSAFMCGKDIDNMINETVIGKILHGIRGEDPCDMKELKRIILSCARMMIENKNILEFDLNPLIVGEDDKYYAVDVRIRVE